MSAPPERWTFFLDRSLGSRTVADALRSAGELVEIHADHFPPNAADEIWLAEAGARGWVVLAKDPRIMRRPLERRALERAGVAAFFLPRGDRPGPDMAFAYVSALARMKRLLASFTRPLIGIVSYDGEITVKVGVRRGGIRR